MTPGRQGGRQGGGRQGGGRPQGGDQHQGGGRRQAGGHRQGVLAIAIVISHRPHLIYIRIAHVYELVEVLIFAAT